MQLTEPHSENSRSVCGLYARSQMVPDLSFLEMIFMSASSSAILQVDDALSHLIFGRAGDGKHGTVENERGTNGVCLMKRSCSSRGSCDAEAFSHGSCKGRSFGFAYRIAAVNSSILRHAVLFPNASRAFRQPRHEVVVPKSEAHADQPLHNGQHALICAHHMTDVFPTTGTHCCSAVAQGYLGVQSTTDTLKVKL